MLGQPRPRYGPKTSIGGEKRAAYCDNETKSHRECGEVVAFELIQEEAEVR